MLFVDEEITMNNVKNDPRCVSLMEKRLLDIIVKHNIYKDEHLRILFDQFKRSNNEVDHKDVKQAIDNVMAIMDE